jgi:hypothetical protein
MNLKNGENYSSESRRSVVSQYVNGVITSRRVLWDLTVAGLWEKAFRHSDVSR